MNPTYDHLGLTSASTISDLNRKELLQQVVGCSQVVVQVIIIYYIYIYIYI